MPDEIERISDLLLDAFFSRQMLEVKMCIYIYQKPLRAVSPSASGAPRLFFALAYTLPYVGVLADVVREFGKAYSDKPWPQMPGQDRMWVEAALALVAVYDCRYADAETCCQWVYDNASWFGPPLELLGAVDLAKAEALRQKALYPIALTYAESALKRFSEAGLPGMEAITRVRLGWLHLQLSDARQAHEQWHLANIFLEGRDDWANLGNIRFYQARWLGRAGRDDESLIAYQQSIGFYVMCTWPPRNLQRAKLCLADHQLRLAKALLNKDPVLARQMQADAYRAMECAEVSLDRDDSRNKVRLFLTKANWFIHGPRPNLASARSSTKMAHDIAEANKDELMIARCWLRAATVEAWASQLQEEHTDKLYLRCIAAKKALNGLNIARRLTNDRLIIRCQAFLAGMYLCEPFWDISAATEHAEGAAARVNRHADVDYLFKETQDLLRRVKAAPGDSDAAVILSIEEDTVLNQSLETTVQAVEHAIIEYCDRLFGGNARISRLLGTGTPKIEKHLQARANPWRAAVPPSHGRIFTIRTSHALSRPLDDTIHDLEYAIIGAAFIHHNCDQKATRYALHIAFERFYERFYKKYSTSEVVT